MAGALALLAFLAAKPAGHLRVASAFAAGALVEVFTDVLEERPWEG